MDISNKAILEEANEAITRGDNEGFLKFCTDDTRWEFVGDKVLKGKEAVRKWMTDTYSEPPKFVVKHLIGEDNFVTAIGTIKLKDKEGTVLEHTYCDVWRFNRGKIAELMAFVI